MPLGRTSMSGGGIDTITASTYWEETEPTPSVKVLFTRKETSSLSTFIVYTISSNDGCQLVERRYRQFIWLDACMKEKYPFVVHPPLPEPQILGRFKPMFIEVRRRRLHAYLYRLLSHPVLKGSDALRCFLSKSTEWMRSIVRKDRRHLVSGAYSKTLGHLQDVSFAIRRTRERNRRVHQLVRETEIREKRSFSVKEQEQIEGSVESDDLFPGDAEMTLHQNHSRELSILLRDCRASTLQLLDSNRNRSSELHLFSGTVQSAATSLRHHCSDVAYYLERLAVASRTHASKHNLFENQGLLNFLLSIDYYSGSAGLAYCMMQKRNRLRISRLNAYCSLRYYQSKLDKAIESAPKGGTSNTTKLEIARNTKRRECENFDEILRFATGSCSTEMNRWNAHRHRGIRSSVADFARNQIAFYEQASAMWETLLNDLSAYKPG